MRIRDQQVAEKKALQRSCVEERDHDREIMRSNAARRAEEDRQLLEYKREQQNVYKDSLDQQVPIRKPKSRGRNASGCSSRCSR